jgi:hypothetical protein
MSWGNNDGCRFDDNLRRGSGRDRAGETQLKIDVTWSGTPSRWKY